MNRIIGPMRARDLLFTDVIKIETPERLDVSDGWGGSRDGPDFQNLHRNKRSLTLNLKDPRGLDVFHKLVAGADVVAENRSSSSDSRSVRTARRASSERPRPRAASIPMRYSRRSVIPSVKSRRCTAPTWSRREGAPPCVEAPPRRRRR